MKLMPASRAFATIRDDVASSVGPPNIMVPRQMGETFRPLRPSWRYCMGMSSLALPERIASLRAQAKQTRAAKRDFWIVYGASREVVVPAKAGTRTAESSGGEDWQRTFATTRSCGYGSRRSPGRRRSASLAPQNLEHAIGGGDAALAGGDFGGDEHQAPGRAHHAGARDQDVADLAGLDKMHVELDRRHGLLARNVAGGHAAGAVGERHQHAALYQAAAVVVLVGGRQGIFMHAADAALQSGPTS